jgi:hypothetical protein
VIPELQDLQVGDLIEIAPDIGHEILEMERNQYLLTGTEDGTWIWILDPVDADATGLITPSRGTWDRGWGMRSSSVSSTTWTAWCCSPRPCRGSRNGLRTWRSWPGRPPGIVTLLHHEAAPRGGL